MNVDSSRQAIFIWNVLCVQFCMRRHMLGFKKRILESNRRSKRVHLTELCKWNGAEGVVPKQPGTHCTLQSLSKKASCVKLPLWLVYWFYTGHFSSLRTSWWLPPLPSCGWHHPLLGLKACLMWSGPPVLQPFWPFLTSAKMSTTTARQVLCLTWADWTPLW